MKTANFKKKNLCCRYNLIILISSFSIIFSSCRVVSRNLDAKNESPVEIANLQQDQSAPEITKSPVNDGMKPTNFKCENQTELISFKEVSFQCKIPLISIVETSEEPAAPLEREDDKPDYVQSRSILFKFKGEYAEQHKESFFLPKINIYPIAEYRQAGAISVQYTKWFDEAINTLQEIISKKTAKTEEISQGTFHEGSPRILAHFKPVSFKNGQGVIYITQYNVDWANIINNQQLNYIFQGITADKKYYVWATFPITLKELPDSIYDNKFGDYELPQTYFDKKKDRAKYTAYKKYLASIEALLNKKKASDFEPDLSKIEETLTSLEVNWKD
jgi:hypothetical protein